MTYSIAGQTTAVRISNDPNPDNNGLFYLYSDHPSTCDHRSLLRTGLGSASAMQHPDGTVTQTRYLPLRQAQRRPFGGYRDGSGGNPMTDRGYTGHKHNDDLGLIYMGARWYCSGIARFASADTIVPDPTNPQQYNRYSYTLNNPIVFSDPSGHCAEFGDDDCWSMYDRNMALCGEACYDLGWGQYGYRFQKDTYDILKSGWRPPAKPVEQEAVSDEINYGAVGEALGNIELAGSTVDFALDQVKNKGGRFLPGQTGTLLVISASVANSRSNGNSWAQTTYNAGIDVAYDAAVDFVAGAAGIAAGVESAAHVGPAAPAVGVLIYGGIQYGAIEIVDPIKDNFQEQSWNQMVDRVNDIDIFGPLTIDVGPGPRPFGPFWSDGEN